MAAPQHTTWIIVTYWVKTSNVKPLLCKKAICSAVYTWGMVSSSSFWVVPFMPASNNIALSASEAMNPASAPATAPDRAPARLPAPASRADHF